MQSLVSNFNESINQNEVERFDMHTDGKNIRPNHFPPQRKEKGNPLSFSTDFKCELKH